MTIDEEKLSKIYQQGKGQGPSAQLDKAILEAAHAAVKQDKDDAQKVTAAAGKRTKSSGPFSGGWPAMASIAALLLITVILVPLIEQETPPEALDYSDEAADRLNEKHMEKDSSTNSDELPAAPEAKMRSLTNKQSVEAVGQQDVLRETAALPRKKSSSHQLDEASRSKPATASGFMSPLMAPAPSAVTPSEQGAAVTGISVRETEFKSDDYQQEISSTADMAEEAIKEAEVILQPDKWLQKIRELIEKRNFTEARDELEKFKQHYPDEEIDAEISRAINEYFQDE